jgi:hypothetical protein
MISFRGNTSTAASAWTRHEQCGISKSLGEVEAIRYQPRFAKIRRLKTIGTMHDASWADCRR